MLILYAIKQERLLGCVQPSKYNAEDQVCLREKPHLAKSSMIDVLH